MRKILLISSHYPPSNLTAVHRIRMLAKHLPSFGWKPIVLTVHEKFYEEELDFELNESINKDQQIERVDAFKITKPRVVGDVGLRAFFQLKKKAIEIISKEKIDFVYIFIPSFYVSLLGTLLHKRFGVKFGIDYIDPWVHFFPGSEKKLSRHWWSTILAKILEPLAVKNVSLITGVSEKYYLPVFERNPSLYRKVVKTAIPYGWDKEDNTINIGNNNSYWLFNENEKIKLIYPGAFLPHSKKIIQSLFKVISTNRELFREVEFYFIGTGKIIDAKLTSPVKAFAEQYGIYGEVIFEYPKRLSYLNTLAHINRAAGMFILGSSEAHYTPSKLFNSFITRRPIFAILHEQSSGKDIIESSGWGIVTPYNNDLIGKQLEDSILENFKSWLLINKNNQWKFDEQVANEYSIRQITSNLNDSILAAL